MAAIYGHQIVDRARSILTAAPYAYTESIEPLSFDFQPSGNADAVFRIDPLESAYVTGQSSYVEDRVDDLVIWVAHLLDQENHDARRRRVLQSVHSITRDLTRDAFVSSGDYAVVDDGRSSRIEVLPDNQILMLRLVVPVQYEVQL